MEKYEIVISDVVNDIILTSEDHVIGVTTEKGPPGPKGDPGVGIPTGGATGQVLAKIDDTDFNTKWVSGGAGGTGNTVYTQDTQPATTNEGDQWFNTLNGTLQTYTTLGWQSLTLDGQNF